MVAAVRSRGTRARITRRSGESFQAKTWVGRAAQATELLKESRLNMYL